MRVWWNGRHDGFRCHWGNPWEFESLHSHHVYKLFREGKIVKINVSRLGNEDYEDELDNEEEFVKLTKRVKNVTKRKDDDVKIKRRQRQKEREDLEKEYRS